VLDVDVLQVL